MPKGRKKQAKQLDQTEAKAYRHAEADSPLRPDVGTQAQFRKKKPPVTYRYDSSLSPALDWDGQNGARELGEWLLGVIEGGGGQPPPPPPFAGGVHFSRWPRRRVRAVACRGDRSAQAPVPAVPRLGGQGRAPLVR